MIPDRFTEFDVSDITASRAIGYNSPEASWLRFLLRNDNYKPKAWAWYIGQLEIEEPDKKGMVYAFVNCHPMLQLAIEDDPKAAFEAMSRMPEFIRVTGIKLKA